LIAFLLVSGFVEKRWFDIAISMVVLFLFGGSLIMGVLPTWNAQISWDGHLCGAIAGAVLAFLNKRPVEGNSIAIGAAILWGAQEIRLGLTSAHSTHTLKFHWDGEKSPWNGMTGYGTWTSLTRSNPMKSMRT
jgi:hypothetical protein